MQTPPLTPLAAAALHVGLPERVLEVECGEGDGALFLAREFPRARVRGVDRSERAVRRATSRVGLDPEGRVAFKLGAPNALPFPDGLFDLLVEIDGIPSPAEAARVLRPGGHLILARSQGLPSALDLGSKLGRRRLRRHGFELAEGAEAGDGSFSVFRLGDAGRAARDD
jgi:SAM-dependent methyltransferase